MNWRDEVVPNGNKERDAKGFIKRELMNYYFYLELMKEYQDIVNTFSDLQDNPSAGGSVIKAPDSSRGNTSAQERLTYNKIDAESNLQYYQYKLSVLDSWMNVLTEAQHDTIKVYVMKYRCKQLDDAADELNYKRDTVEKNVERAINRIYGKIKKIC